MWIDLHYYILDDGFGYIIYRLVIKPLWVTETETNTILYIWFDFVLQISSNVVTADYHAIKLPLQVKVLV